MTPREAALRGFAWGCVGGLALVALMYYSSLLLGLRTLPALLSGPVLYMMPGFVFGFLIDTLQHAGKVVEEGGLIVAIVLALGVLGALSSLAGLRIRSVYLPFAFAALGWIVVAGVLLPIGGAGLLGLDDGPSTPVIWATLFAIYAVILQYGEVPVPGVDMGRRRLLSGVPVAIVAISVGGLALKLVPGWAQAIFSAPESGLLGPAPAITPVANFYVVSKNVVDPSVDASSWSLKVGGLVDNPLRMTLDELKSRPVTSEYVTLECISNNVGGELMSTGLFAGVSLQSLIAEAKPRGDATWVTFQAVDGYTESLQLAAVTGSPEILVAHTLDGAPLPSQHGFPARMLIPGHYGMKGPKWLQSITLGTSETRGYWEQQGWDHNALVKTTSRIDSPRDGDIVRIGAIQVAGVAFAGTRGIGKVEYSTDGGSTWNQAQLDTPLSKLTWTLWRANWTPGSEGAYKLAVRATDGEGAAQTPKGAPSYPDGASGYHTISINISK
jgi:DMSO/TMAO reductase YedYZ molybdopterin-dependent catalytic subunit